MNTKKKMNMGILAGALGIALIGGGTWAAFNDVETVNSSIAVGTLDLAANPSTLFNVENLKPGDWFEKTLTLSNAGSLDINDINLYLTPSNWQDVQHQNLPDNGVNTLNQFLQQFDVTITRGNTEIFKGSADTLSAQSLEVSGTANNAVALAPEADMTLKIKVVFNNDTTTYPNSRLQVQNKYQGESVNLALEFEATQMPGEQINLDK